MEVIEVIEVMEVMDTHYSNNNQQAQRLRYNAIL